MREKRTSFFIIGLAVGVGFSVLFAPRSGRDSRASITGAVSHGKARIARTGSQVQKSATALFDRGKAGFKFANGALSAALKAGKVALSARGYHPAPGSPVG